MSYHNWLKIVPKNTDRIQGGTMSRESVAEKAMAADRPSKAAVRLARMLEQRQATAKILVVGEGLFSEKLADYAITMGQRLDCEIVALSVFDNRFHATDCPDGCGKGGFPDRNELDVCAFADKAASYGGVKFSQLSRVGRKEAVIDQVVAEIDGIRYILSEPAAQVEEEHDGRAQLPVIGTTGEKIDDLDQQQKKPEEEADG